jgi:hypothetical protein
MDLTAEYDYVAILDALPENERGILRISELLASQLASGGIDQFRGYSKSKAHLFAYLERIFLPRARAGEHFMLHVISHGGEEGLWVKSTNEDIWWRELTPVLEEINSAMSGHLLANFSSCIGGKAIHIVNAAAERTPFFGMIGPRRTIDAGEAIAANAAFYRSLMSDSDVPKAVEAANSALGDEVMYAVSAEGFQGAKRGKTE